jgi:hypothetical protein
MITQTPAETQAAVQRLHALYCELTKRPEALRFYERAWHDLLYAPQYPAHAARLWKDIQHLVRYLRMGIRDQKRNLGCLKLKNFLQQDQFLADLAEARATLSERRERAAQPHTPAPGEAPVPIEATREVAARLRQFKEAL